MSYEAQTRVFPSDVIFISDIYSFAILEYIFSSKNLSNTRKQPSLKPTIIYYPSGDTIIADPLIFSASF